VGFTPFRCTSREGGKGNEKTVLSILPKRKANDEGRLAVESWRENATAEIPMQQQGMLPAYRESAVEEAPQESEKGEVLR